MKAKMLKSSESWIFGGGTLYTLAYPVADNRWLRLDLHISEPNALKVLLGEPDRLMYAEAGPNDLCIHYELSVLEIEPGYNVYGVDNLNDLTNKEVENVAGDMGALCYGARPWEEVFDAWDRFMYATADTMRQAMEAPREQYDETEVQMEGA